LRVKGNDGSGGKAPLDESEVRHLIETAYPRLAAALTLVCGSRAAAEDAVQEALARCWEQSVRGRVLESPEAWMTTVALNLARSRLRRARVELRARGGLASAPPPEPSADAVDVRRALAGLPARQREAVVLHYFLDLDVAAVARSMRVAEGTVKTSLHRARRSLGLLLGEADPAPEEVDHGRR
jgi:RNA polymerase sigma-70 factor (ECF subfamily)